MSHPVRDEQLASDVVMAREVVLPGDDVNPYAPPAMPEIATGPSESKLVSRLKRKTGNDLIVMAIVATVFAFFIPFVGIALDMVSLFLLARVMLSRSKPDVIMIVLAVLVAIWNLLRLAAVALVLAIVLLQ